MVRYLANNFDVHYRNVPKYPDYYPKNPGGKEGWRSMEPVAFDASRLGDEFANQRESFKGTLLMGRIAMDQVEAQKPFSRGAGWHTEERRVGKAWVRQGSYWWQR